MTKIASLGGMTHEQRIAFGKSRRNVVHRVNQGPWVKPSNRRDPVDTIIEVNSKRVPALVPIKMGRMSESPFRFFRGAVPIMAADLASTMSVGLKVQMCGDAHLLNLGAYAAPDGHLVFDINDFDETYPGPFEWDLKRLATSFVIAGEEAGEKQKRCEEAVTTLVSSYRSSMHQFAEMRKIDLERFEVHRHSKSPSIRDILARAERMTPKVLLQKYTVAVKGELPKLLEKPPKWRHLPKEEEKSVLEALTLYRTTLSADRQSVIEAYHPTDVAFKIVGIGSVGTRCYVILGFGAGINHPLFLQMKEEPPSCYMPYVADVPKYAHEGKRVADGQLRLQTVSDPFLGYTTIDNRDYLVRQLSDYKAAVDPTELKGDVLAEFAHMCGQTLAMAHARTGDPAMLSGYVGHSDTLDKALANFAMTYAAQNAEDFELFKKAIRSGKIQSIEGI
jgi:uncharacterized protein (DUF2252 family)